MSSPIEVLLDCYNGNDSIPDLPTAVIELGKKNIRVISIELFSWIRRQHRFRNEKSLTLNMESTWCRELIRLLKLWPELDEILEAKSEKCNFRESVPRTDLDYIRKLVIEKYKPAIRR